MAKLIKNSFSADLVRQAKFFKALSHPARLSILQYLAETKTCITGDIADELPLSRTTVNQHLKELKEVGLIVGTVEGVKTNYCLNTQAIKDFKSSAISFLEDLNIDTINCKK
ncbi:ArsR/SmtB family transcription factor [Alkalitalea saponilacus]|uniref:ArsR family transcriptional regulator n=1 Tax=Alkalitalea saponilacus TaxID=889453 RepID=A0A1T5HSQ5_9BACT|nr:metalloregulator ArsR/SmtB family transcription factor [Alkalitalea saponilacus]ASB49229.1 transcriptional regulator [Alkalitalea saponilacus]SKC23713.1 ArsR family transcriptional regulator [Alkalitalea saponilacus]